MPFFPCVMRPFLSYLFFRTLKYASLVMIWHIFDIFFVCFHSLLIVFNLFGWIWKRTRILNLVVLALTAVSWLFLGLIVGTLGYCPLTDWHFRILEKLGKTDLPDSYIKYLADRLTGLGFNPSLVDKVTLYVFLGVFVISLSLNVRDFIRKKHK
jgi:hypothetical protein